MTRQIALIVDDEPDIRELIGITLGRMGVDARSAGDLRQARALLAQHEFDLCLTDMRLPDGNGIDLVRHIQQQKPSLRCAVMRAHGNVESAVQALKAGAFDFVSKPLQIDVLRKLVQQALRLGERRETSTGLTLIGDSAAIAAVRATAAKLARSQAPVYIAGESGTGKELVARLIHEQGPRAGRPFVPVNCGAIPGELMESEFFGHKKGSFTGAVGDKDGLFQAADGGTLFLDEVADLPLHMQVKLLRAIQEKAVRPVGAPREMPVDVRILCATHRDLPRLVEEGLFRQDLFYRINVIRLDVPALREHAEDIDALARFILGRLATQTARPAPALEPSALEALRAYAFPGNVRELENILERALTLCDGASITTRDLQLPEAAPAKRGALRTGESLEDHLAGIERDLIVKALDENRWNRTLTAQKLGMTFRALRYRLKKLGIE